MLARQNRITRGSEYKQTVRQGRRVRRANIVASVVRRADDADGIPRFGFIVSRRVGGAVVRNRVRRRLKAACRSRLLDIGACDVVIRALPASANAPWDTLVSETVQAVHHGLTSS